MSRVQKFKSKKTVPIILTVVLILAVLAALWFFVINRKYTVSFNTGGGSAVASVRVKKGETVTRPEDPVKEGYAFVEWVCSGRSYDFNTPVRENLTVYAVYKEYIQANSIYFVKDNFRVAVGKTLRAGIAMEPAAPSSPVCYTSSDPSVFTVNASGYISGVSVGIAEITAEIDGLQARATVEVSAEITGLEFELEQYTVAAGDTVATAVKILPEDVPARNLSYLSTDTEIASVDDFGVISGVSPGEATIIAAAANGVEAQTRVVVEKAVESIVLEPAEALLELAEGKSFQFRVHYSPADALPSAYRWSSSNINIAEIDREGIITPKSPGNVTITCICGNNIIARAKLTVAARAQSVAADAYDIELNPGETVNLAEMLHFTPEIVKPQYTAVWTQKSGSGEITVDESGLVSAVKPTEKPAEVELTLTGLLGDKITLTFSVSVLKIHAQAIALEGFSREEEAKLTLSPGESHTIRAKVLPENATDQSLRFELDFSGVAASCPDPSACIRLDGSTLTAVRGFEGSCSVIISAENGIKRSLTVFVPPESVPSEAE